MQNTLSSVSSESRIGQSIFPGEGGNTGLGDDLFSVLFAQMGMQFAPDVQIHSEPLGAENEVISGQGLPQIGGELPPPMVNPELDTGFERLPDTLSSPHMALPGLAALEHGDNKPLFNSAAFGVTDQQRKSALDVLSKFSGEQANPSEMVAQLKAILNDGSSAPIPEEAIEALVNKVQSLHEPLQNAAGKQSPALLLEPDTLAVAPTQSSLAKQVEAKLNQLFDGQSKGLVGQSQVQQAASLRWGQDEAMLRGITKAPKVELNLAASGDDSQPKPLEAMSVSPGLGSSQVNSLHELLAQRREAMDMTLANIGSHQSGNAGIAETLSLQNLPAASALDGRLMQINALGTSADGDKFDLSNFSQINLVDFQLQEAMDGDEMPAAELWKMTLPEEQSEFIDAMRGRLSVMMGQSLQRAQISLNPQELGQIDLQVDLQEGELSLNLSAENPQVRELIESALPRLREMLESKGFNLGDAEVASEHQQSSQQGQDAPSQQANSGSSSSPSAPSIDSPSTEVVIPAGVVHRSDSAISAYA